MWKPTYQPELYHHGVKGMKWGVRKDRKTSGERKSHSTSSEKIGQYEKTSFDVFDWYERKVTCKSGRRVDASFFLDQYDKDPAPKLKLIDFFKNNDAEIDRKCMKHIEAAYSEYAVNPKTGKSYSTSKEFLAHMKLEAVDAHREDLEVIYTDDNGCLGYHMLSVYIDPKTKKVLTTEMNG